MRRTTIIRGLLMVAVLVLASATTGCLKASVEVSYEYENIAVMFDTPLEGKFTFTLTGMLAGGMYNMMTITWLDELGDAIEVGPDYETQFEVEVPLAPVGKFRQGVLDLAEVNNGDGVVPPADSFWRVADVRFTFSFVGVGLKPSVVTIPADVID